MALGDVAAKTCAGLIVSLSAVAVVAAATQAPSTLPPESVEDRVTVVGCVVHEAEYASTTAAPRTGAPAGILAEFVIVEPASGPAYRVTGTREAELIPHEGRRVEVTGTIERPRVGSVPTDVAPGAQPIGTSGSGLPGVPAGTRSGAAGVTPEGAPAHESGDAEPGTTPAAPELDAAELTEPAATRPVAGVGELPRLNITSVRRVDGPCESPDAALPSQPRPEAPAAPASSQRPVPGTTPAVPSPSAEVPAAASADVTVIGCVMRSTPTGPVAGAPDGEVTLTRATVLGDGQAPAAERQPGNPGAATLASPPPAPDAERRAFVLVAGAAFDLASLVEHMGRRVEVTGRLEDEAAAEAQTPVPSRGEAAEPPAPETAHPSAPVERLRVVAFRPVSGACF